MLQTPVVRDELTVFPQTQVPLILSGAVSPVFHCHLRGLRYPAFSKSLNWEYSVCHVSEWSGRLLTL